METKDRDKIRAAAEKATKGPWKQMTGKVVAAAYIVAECDFADARFIALTDPDKVIALLDALDSAEKENSRLDRELCDENSKERQALMEIKEKLYPQSGGAMETCYSIAYKALE